MRFYSKQNGLDSEQRWLYNVQRADKIILQKGEAGQMQMRQFSEHECFITSR
jgi:hypothetical protein